MLGPLLLLAEGQRRTHPGGWIWRLRRIPPLAMVGLGLGFRTTIAFLAGLVLRRGPFLRTPKYALEGTGGAWRGTAYVPRADAITWVEAGLATVALLGAGIALGRGLLGVSFSLAVFGLAYGVVATYSVVEGIIGRPRRFARRGEERRHVA